MDELQLFQEGQQGLQEQVYDLRTRVAEIAMSQRLVTVWPSNRASLRG